MPRHRCGRPANHPAKKKKRGKLGGIHNKSGEKARRQRAERSCLRRGNNAEEEGKEVRNKQMCIISFLCLYF
ncbi:hypothetical protein TRSC58_07601 [Trypanosoma rangeli SC58]|uniref:Uncharacterized protein n=1 Tax=Trypanosoma rangeli SC58 TaxID=429131 RepID=A0A061ISJ0_TRYRA|nr:hypothetical protein TRSC58_07601 [Trypanosoma rangeli SC58]